MAGARAKVVLALLALSIASCVTADGAGRSDMILRSRKLIGFDAGGAMIVLDGAGEIRAFDLPHGPERALISIKDGVSDGLMRSLIKEHGWRGAETWQPDQDLSLVFRIDPSLGDRRTLSISAEANGKSTLLQQIPISGATRVEGIARSPDGRFAIVIARSNTAERTFIVDVRSAKAALLNLRALEAYATGDRLRAAALLERAVTIDPRAGDAMYNLACVHALLGDVERAADELGIALSIDPVRYRILAKKDPDLAVVRELPRVKAVLAGSHASH